MEGGRGKGQEEEGGEKGKERRERGEDRGGGWKGKEGDGGRGNGEGGRRKGKWKGEAQLQFPLHGGMLVIMPCSSCE